MHIVAHAHDEMNHPSPKTANHMGMTTPHLMPQNPANHPTTHNRKDSQTYAFNNNSKLTKIVNAIQASITPDLGPGPALV
jgi:hypothetical protein